MNINQKVIVRSKKKDLIVERNYVT